MNPKKDHLDELISHKLQSMLYGHSISILAIRPLHAESRKNLDAIGDVAEACRVSFDSFLEQGKIKKAGAA